MDEIWRIIDFERLQASYSSQQSIKNLKLANPSQLFDVLYQYRFYCKAYINDLAHLVYRLEDCQIRSTLGQILSDELGCGDEKLAHPFIYDEFLSSMNPNVDFRGEQIKANSHLEEKIKLETINSNIDFVIGLRGMGGECLCQVYLDAIYNQFTCNQWIIERRSSINWIFWDLHVGPVDIEHRNILRQSVQKYIDMRPSASDDILRGFIAGKDYWQRYWNNIFVEFGV
jgi:hypothetical protein